MKEIPKAYDPKKVEDKIYAAWEKSGFFNPDNLDLPEDAEKFSIAMPPPNATGVLHLGHASMLAYQDLMIRYNRMREKQTLWLPGTDHASIATQTKVEKIIAEEEKTKYDLGREKFLERVNEYVENSKNTIKNQTRKMGSSCNWSRERYTLDDGLSHAVQEVFVKMYNDNLIYLGNRIVNWCPRCESTLADDEVEHKDQKANLYYFKYDKDFPITIATTRPETKLGDTAVAVNPKDERYKKYIGKIYKIDLGNGEHEIKIIADRKVDMKFGTGALGVTPAHSMADWEMSQKNDLKYIQVIGRDGKMNYDAGMDYAGLTVLKAREKFVKYLEKNNLIEKVEEVDQSLSVCYRCRTPIEPLLSLQWFVDVDKKITIKDNKYFQDKSLKEVSLEVVKNKKIEIIPERFEKTYYHWMKNLHDWCISRQIWFGHRIPVRYCMRCCEDYGLVIFLKEPIDIKELRNVRFITTRQLRIDFIEQYPENWQNKIDKIEINKELTKNNIIASVEKPESCPICHCKYLVQDPNTLDTWFSSGLWTFSTLLEQDYKKYKTFKEWVENSPDLKKFHPISVMETGYDILFFWVARMILMTTYTMGEIPFEKVYLHGMVCDKQGRKMSKSLGNGIDPIEMIEKYGTDALRLSMIIGSSPGNDIKMYEEKIEGYRNFVNKLWNVSRFILQNQESRIKNQEIDCKNLTLADRWILSKLNNLIEEVTDDLENYNFSLAGEKLRDFTWNDFADWYLEISKIEKNKDEILVYVLKQLLILWHPFIPFVTEEIWKNIKLTSNPPQEGNIHTSKNPPSPLLQRGNSQERNGLLMVEKWPGRERKFSFPTTESDFEIIKNIIVAIRNARAEYKIEPSKKIEAVIYVGKAGNENFRSLQSQSDLIKNLRTGIDKLEIKEKGGKIKDAVYLAVGDVEIYLLGMVDKEKEKKNLEKEVENLERYLSQIKNKLDNKEFTANAPKEIVKKEKSKYDEGENKLKKLEEKLKSLS